MKLWKISLTSFEHRSDILIAGLGAVTPIGRTALASAAAVRAGLSGFSQHAFMVDSVGEPICVAQCSWLTADSSITSRICDCLVAAIRESLGSLQSATDVGRRPTIMLFVNLPSHRPGLPESLSQAVRETLEQTFAGVFSCISLAQLGHAGGIIALQSAIRMLDEASEVVCVVAGTDSYLEPDMLEWLDDTEQLHGAGERNNAWGFVPGEGAGAVVLIAADLVKRLNIQILGRVAGIGVGHETKLIRTGTVCLGEGLTAAFRSALAGLSSQKKLTDIYCDMNGEPYRADEFAFAVTRTRERFVSASDFIAPADCWGDVGAASALLFIALACIAGAKDYANGTNTLVWVSSETGERGAAVIETAAGR